MSLAMGFGLLRGSCANDRGHSISSPVERGATGKGTRRSMVVGLASKSSRPKPPPPRCAWSPSPALRLVPLPRFGGEESASYLASQLRNFLPGGVDEFGVRVGVAPDAPAAFGRFGQEHPGAL